MNTAKSKGSELHSLWSQIIDGDDVDDNSDGGGGDDDGVTQYSLTDFL